MHYIVHCCEVARWYYRTQMGSLSIQSQVEVSVSGCWGKWRAVCTVEAVSLCTACLWHSIGQSRHEHTQSLQRASQPRCCVDCAMGRCGTSAACCTQCGGISVCGDSGQFVRSCSGNPSCTCTCYPVQWPRLVRNYMLCCDEIEENKSLTRCRSYWLAGLWVNVKLLLLLSKTLWEGMESRSYF